MPYARKKGREVGQFYRVNYYCRHCGTQVIWLVDERGNWDWTVDAEFLQKHFEIVESSNERSIYGKGKPHIEALTRQQVRSLQSKYR